MKLFASSNETKFFDHKKFNMFLKLFRSSSYSKFWHQSRKRRRQQRRRPPNVKQQRPIPRVRRIVGDRRNFHHVLPPNPNLLSHRHKNIFRTPRRSAQTIRKTESSFFSFSLSRNWRFHICQRIKISWKILFGAWRSFMEVYLRDEGWQWRLNSFWK